MADTVEMERFLADVEKRAFRIARFAVGHHDDALDILQEAMINLVQRYAASPSEEWAPLFYKILESRIRDHQRRQKVRNKIHEWFGFGGDVSALDAVQHDAAVAAQVVADDRRSGAGHEHRVLAKAAEYLGDELLARALDKHPVVAFGRVDPQRLDVDEADRQSGAEHAVLGDHEVVAEFRADDDHGVEAVAAVDVDRRVDRVLDQVGAAAAAQVRQLAEVLLRSGERERLDDERVVVGFAEQVERIEVVEDDEQVVADAFALRKPPRGLRLHVDENP